MMPLVQDFLILFQTSTAFRAVLLFWLGACLASFLSLIMYRWPRKLPWMAARSACPHCGHTLSVIDLIPVLSWLWQRGRCRYCGTPFGALYLWLELAGGAIGIALAVYL